MTKILIACGGSGGHIFPGIALAEALADLKKDTKVFIVTSDRRIDTQIFREEKFPYFVLPYNRFPSSLNPLKIFGFTMDLVRAVRKASGILRERRPVCVVGLGGYVSGPVVLAARFMGIPTLIHEQNVVPSLTNRISAIFADKICVSFDETKDYFKKASAVKTGNPIRYGFLKRDTNSSHEALGLRPGIFTVLVMGGSQGSTFLNDSFKEAMSRLDDGLRRNLQVVHIAGAKDHAAIKDKYEKIGLAARVYPFLDRMGQAYEIADLVISRAGATAISEISAFGKPSILVPYPEKRIHQRENAEFFSNRGAGLCVEEKNLAPHRLQDLMMEMINDRGRMRRMADQAKSLGDPEAARKLAKETLNLIKK